MSYKLNISKDGKHVFSTDESTCGVSRREAENLYQLFCTKFPVEEGYKITVYGSEQVYEDITDELPKQNTPNVSWGTYDCHKDQGGK